MADIGMTIKGQATIVVLNAAERQLVAKACKAAARRVAKPADAPRARP